MAGKAKAKRKRNPYPGKPPGLPVWYWVEQEEALDRYMDRWARRLLVTGVDEKGRRTVQFLGEEAQRFATPPRRSKLLQKRIDQLRVRKAAERKARARQAALRRWHPAGYKARASKHRYGPASFLASLGKDRSLSNKTAISDA